MSYRVRASYPNMNGTKPLPKISMGAFAEFERTLIREHQREGVALAKSRGVYKGRTKTLCNDEITKLRQRAKSGEPKAVLAGEFGISRDTLYRYFKAGQLDQRV